MLKIPHLLWLGWSQPRATTSSHPPAFGRRHQVVQMRRGQTSHHLAMWPGGFDDLTRNWGIWGFHQKNGGFNHWLSFRWLSQKIINPKTDFLNSVSSLIIWNIWKSVGMIIPNIWKMFQTTNQLSFTYWVSWKTELSQRMDSWQISTEWI